VSNCKGQHWKDLTHLPCTTRRHKKKTFNQYQWGTYFEVVELGQHLSSTVPRVVELLPHVFQRRHHPPYLVRHRHVRLWQQLLTALVKRRVVNEPRVNLRLLQQFHYLIFILLKIHGRRTRGPLKLSDVHKDTLIYTIQKSIKEKKNTKDIKYKKIIWT